MLRTCLVCLVSLTLWACASQPGSVADLSEADAIAAAVTNDNPRALQPWVADTNAPLLDGETLLVAATRQNSADTVHWLLQRGIEPDGVAAPGMPSALWYAAANGETRLTGRLLDAGADVNYADASGRTPLLVAAMGGHFTTAKLLLRAGANVNSQVAGKPLLMHVIENNDLLMAQLLIDAGADVNQPNAQGKTALQIAREQQLRDMILLLLNSGSRS